jgi:tetratricopeptide (TPR) repeat protein
MSKPSQLIIKGDVFYHYFRRDANAEARRLYKAAIDLDASNSMPYALLAYAELTAWLYNWDQDMTGLDDALKHAKTAVTNDVNDYYSHWILADVHLYRKEYTEAANKYEEVLEMVKKGHVVPEEERAIHVDWADMLLLTGDAEQAISVATKAIASCPVAERWFYWVLGWAYYADGQYQNSLDTMYKLGNPRNAMRKNVIANLVALGRTNEADVQAQKFLNEENNQGITYNKTGGPVWPAMQKIEDRVPFQDTKQLALWKQHLETAFSKQVAP